jgi:hypothetical protein
MDVVDLPLEQIIPYARNPRRNEQSKRPAPATGLRRGTADCRLHCGRIHPPCPEQGAR